MGRVGEHGYDASLDEFLGAIDQARLPLKYLASMFGAGNEAPVRYALRKQLAVRYWRRHQTVGDTGIDPKALLTEVDCSPEEADAIYRLTAIARLEDRFVIPPMHREEAIEMLDTPLEAKGKIGVGFRQAPVRGA